MEEKEDQMQEEYIVRNEGGGVDEDVGERDGGKTENEK